MGLLPALACGVLAGRAQAQDKGVTGSQVIVGQNINLQAGRNAYGAKVQAGIQACVAQVNGSGGVAGRRVVLRTLNDDNNAVKAEANARQLVAEGA